MIGRFIRRLLRPIRCRMGWCRGKVSSTEYGIGWLCQDCGSLRHWESWDRVFGRRFEHR